MQIFRKNSRDSNLVHFPNIHKHNKPNTSPTIKLRILEDFIKYKDLKKSINDILENSNQIKFTKENSLFEDKVDLFVHQSKGHNKNDITTRGLVYLLCIAVCFEIQSDLFNSGQNWQKANIKGNLRAKYQQGLDYHKINEIFKQEISKLTEQDLTLITDKVNEYISDFKKLFRDQPELPSSRTRWGSVLTNYSSLTNYLVKELIENFQLIDEHIINDFPKFAAFSIENQKSGLDKRIQITYKDYTKAKNIVDKKKDNLYRQVGLDPSSVKSIFKNLTINNTNIPIKVIIGYHPEYKEWFWRVGKTQGETGKLLGIEVFRGGSKAVSFSKFYPVDKDSPNKLPSIKVSHLFTKDLELEQPIREFLARHNEYFIFDDQVISIEKGFSERVDNNVTFKQYTIQQEFIQYSKLTTAIRANITTDASLKKLFKSYYDQLIHMLEILLENGIIHRDIKPDNLLFTFENEEIQIKLTDFGSAIKVRDINAKVNSSSLPPIIGRTLTYYPQRLIGQASFAQVERIAAFATWVDFFSNSCSENALKLRVGQALNLGPNANIILDKITTLLNSLLQSIIQAEDIDNFDKAIDDTISACKKYSRILSPLIEVEGLCYFLNMTKFNVQRNFNG